MLKHRRRYRCSWNRAVYLSKKINIKMKKAFLIFLILYFSNLFGFQVMYTEFLENGEEYIAIDIDTTFLSALTNERLILYAILVERKHFNKILFLDNIEAKGFKDLKIIDGYIILFGQEKTNVYNFSNGKINLISSIKEGYKFAVKGIGIDNLFYMGNDLKIDVYNHQFIKINEYILEKNLKFIYVNGLGLGAEFVYKKNHSWLIYYISMQKLKSKEIPSMGVLVSYENLNSYWVYDEKRQEIYNKTRKKLIDLKDDLKKYLKNFNYQLEKLSLINFLATSNYFYAHIELKVKDLPLKEALILYINKEEGIGSFCHIIPIFLIKGIKVNKFGDVVYFNEKSLNYVPKSNFYISCSLIENLMSK